MVILKTINLVKRFGGLAAVNGVDLDINENEILGIIGPNGAGKTTLVNLISGLIYPTQGEIVFDGINIESKPAYIRTKLGIARTFQLVRPIQGFTAFENIVVGALFGAKENLKQARDSASEICDILELKRRDFPIDKLTVLDLKKLR